MGQKVNPYSLRLGIVKGWQSKWYESSKNYAKTLHEDLKLRSELKAFPESQAADISRVEIVRYPQRLTVFISAARPGVLIGAKGSSIEKLTARLQKFTEKKVQVKIKEVKRSEIDAQVISLNITRQLKSRSPFKRILKMTVANAMRAGIQGIKIKISGRLGGSEMTRVQQVKEGRIPLHTLRADIDYGFSEAMTTYGVIGVKVWIFKGEIIGQEKKTDAGKLVGKRQQEESV